MSACSTTLTITCDTEGLGAENDLKIKILQISLRTDTGNEEVLTTETAGNTPTTTSGLPVSINGSFQAGDERHAWVQATIPNAPDGLYSCIVFYEENKSDTAYKNTANTVEFKSKTQDTEQKQHGLHLVVAHGCKSEGSICFPPFAVVALAAWFSVFDF
ncbi:hypothetical protein BaRGS_00033492 [Batillaria attramentaria]|uniref:Ig-like domain-containing protein n=1 Tax=Batillaria attramentaria TaxID=370345 RepID=A0ABD0JKR2_9CAEN